MAYNLAWSLDASEDVQTIFAYLERVSPIYALTFLDDLFDRANNLVEYPMQGRIVPEVDHPTLREVFVDQYRLIYHIEEQTISVVTVVHMSRDLQTFWRQRN